MGYLFSFRQHLWWNNPSWVYEDTKEKDMSKRFTITGVDDADKIRKDLWNTINSKEKVNINLLHDEDVQTVKVDDKDVIAIHVPRAEYNLRPVYINNLSFASDLGHQL